MHRFAFRKLVDVARRDTGRVLEHLYDDRTGLAHVGGAIVDPADARLLQRASGREVERVRRGIYAPRESWDRADSAARHRMRIDAVMSTRRHSAVLGHASAALLWQIPVRSTADTPVHLIAAPTSAVRSSRGVAVHRQVLEGDDLREVSGWLVTSPLRTVLDLARTLPFLDAVIALDFVLHPRRPRLFDTVTREVLLGALDTSSSRRGAARARRAIEFARSGADNAGEPTSRVVIDRLGFPIPELQLRHSNPRGGSYFTDTEWPEFKLVGEFDGKGKYLKEEYLRGMAPGEAVYEEKIREDHLRAEGNSVARWGWQEVRDPPRLAHILVMAGLPREVRRGAQRSM